MRKGHCFFFQFLIVEDSIVDREDSWSDLHDPGLEGECDGGVAGAELDLHQAPDAVRQLHALVDHVLALERPLSNRERLQVFKIILRQKRIIQLTLFCVIFVLMPSLVHSTPSMVCWISLAAGMSFQVFRNVFFSIAPEKILPYLSSVLLYCK